MLKRHTLALSFFGILSIGVNAQDIPQQTDNSSKDQSTVAASDEKKKRLDELAVRLLDQTINEIAMLKLPRNRATVYALAGHAYWQFDQERSRSLLRSVGPELLAFQTEREADEKKRKNDYWDFYSVNNLRRAAIELIAERDSELALQTLLQTRSQEIVDALVKFRKADTRTGEYNRSSSLAQQEMDLERTIIEATAEQDPERAIKMIKESLANGVSQSVIGLLNKLHKKDPKKAGELADDIIRKLVETDLVLKDDAMRTAIFILSAEEIEKFAASEKIQLYRFSESQLKVLANKLADTFLNATPGGKNDLAASLALTLPKIEKLAPERAAQLRQKLGTLKKDQTPEQAKRSRIEQLMIGDSTAEELLKEAISLKGDSDERMVYSMLATKISVMENEDEAKALIEKIPDEEAKELASDLLATAKTTRAKKADDMESARKSIQAITESNQKLFQLVSLARRQYQIGTDDAKDAAKGLMRDAEAVAANMSDDKEQLQGRFQIIGGYALVDPDRAFQLFEPIIDQINDVVQAYAILSKYESRNTVFSKGELVIEPSGFGANMLLYQAAPQIQFLAKADLERMALLADRFHRADSKTIVRLMLAKGYTQTDKEADSSLRPSFRVY